MSPIQSISEKVHLLPESVQQQVLDYIEFLIAKYDSPSEIPQEAKDFIFSRREKMKANPEGNLEWEDAKKEIYRRLKKDEASV